MATSSAINTLIELATSECDKAAQALGTAIRIADETQKKLDLLLHYRDDYASRFQANQAKGLTITGYRNFQIFLEKLDQAIVGQQQVVGEAQQRVAENQHTWQVAEHKRMSFGTLAERKRKEEQRKESRREQKQMDEFAARKSLNKR